MSKKPATIEETAPAEASAEAIHQQAHTRAQTMIRETRRQIGEQEALIARAQSDLEQVISHASAQDAEAVHLQEHLAQLTTEIEDNRLALNIYTNTARAESIQARLANLEQRQCDLAGQIDTWQRGTVEREKQRTAAQQTIRERIESARATLTGLHQELATLERAALEAHAALGQARLEAIKAELAEVDEQERQAQMQLQIAQQRRASIRQSMTQRLGGYDQLRAEAVQLVPPAPIPEVLLLQQFLTLLETANDARLRMRGYNLPGTMPIPQILAVNENQWRAILSLHLSQQHNNEGPFALQELTNLARHALDAWRASHEQAQARFTY